MMSYRKEICRDAAESDRPRGVDRGFTLIELLTVVAVIAVLAGILIPTAQSVRVSARKAATRVKFSQWSAAIESFRGEYGYYPAFHSSHLVNAGASPADHPFHDVLAGRRVDGAALSGYSAAAQQNPKRIAFHGFSLADFGGGGSLLVDAFGNTEIAVLVDRNLDGVLDAADFGSLPSVGGTSPAEDDFPAAGLRLTVAFYAPEPGTSAEAPAFICSWK